MTQVDAVDIDTRFIEVADGRRLAYCRLGDPAGAAVMSFHGGLSCRLEIGFAAALCRELGVDLIAPDRPGIGLSDFQPRRTLLGWAHDVETLADALGLDRFAVMGWSAGGPYALACAHRLGDRIAAVASVAGMAPLGGPRDIDQLGLAVDRVLFRLCREHVGAAGRLLSAARFAPHALLDHSLTATLRRRGDPDAAFVAALPPATFSTALRAALIGGGLGTACDYHLLGGDWGFALEHIDADVTIWHGLGDTLVPPTHAERLANSLPRARVNLLPDHGHFLPQRRMRDLLLSLLDPPGTAPAP